MIRRGAALAAEIIRLSDRRARTDAYLDIDLRTAVDAAIRDLREIEVYWGTERGLLRLAECQAMLSTMLESV